MEINFLDVDFNELNRFNSQSIQAKDSRVTELFQKSVPQGLDAAAETLLIYRQTVATILNAPDVMQVLPQYLELLEEPGTLKKISQTYRNKQTATNFFERNLGLAYFALDQKEAAREHFLKALAADDSSFGTIAFIYRNPELFPEASLSEEIQEKIGYLLKEPALLEVPEELDIFLHAQNEIDGLLGLSLLFDLLGKQDQARASLEMALSLAKQDASRGDNQYFPYEAVVASDPALLGAIMSAKILLAKLPPRSEALLPSDLFSTYTLATSCYRRKEYPECISYINQLLAVEELVKQGNFSFTPNDLKVLRGLSLLQQQDAATAVADLINYPKKSDFFPKNGTFLRGLAHAASDPNDLEELKKAVQGSKANGRVAALLLYILGSPVSSVTPPKDSHWGLEESTRAVHLALQGEFEKALAIYEKLICDHVAYWAVEDQMTYRKERALIYCMMDRKDEARKALEEVVKQEGRFNYCEDKENTLPMAALLKLLLQL